MVDWSIEALRAAGPVGPIVVACPPGRSGELSGPGVDVVEGGATRSVSVSNALETVETELVAIHDAARPLVDSELVEGVIAALAADPGADGAIAAAPVTDTIKRATEPKRPPAEETGAAFATLSGENAALVVESTVDRGRLWAAQTPQVFRIEALRAALAAWPAHAATDPEQVAEATDEAMLVEAAGGRVLIHPAPPENLKVTTPLDLELAELLLAERVS
jgi:2-C-methyl-D-erythritol 4-phosphate cytidylyltransferase